MSVYLEWVGGVAPEKRARRTNSKEANGASIGRAMAALCKGYRAYRHNAGATMNLFSFYNVTY